MATEVSPLSGRALALESAGMSDAVSVSDLLARASAGDSTAWDRLVERYSRLVWSIVRGYRLDEASARDVAQTVWLRLVEHCDRIREPERLPAWLATTARREAMRVINTQRRQAPVDIGLDLADPTDPPIDESLLDAETAREVLRAFGQLSEGCQELLRLLCADPPLDYEAISEMLGRPVGSIGPTRQRCLDKLRELLGDERR